MKISELVKKLLEIPKREGDLPVVGAGHPGDVGVPLTLGFLTP